MTGYALTGLTRDHALFFLYGLGANGKSVFLNTVSSILATYHRTAPPSAGSLEYVVNWDYLPLFHAAVIGPSQAQRPLELRLLRGPKLGSSLTGRQ